VLGARGGRVGMPLWGGGLERFLMGSGEELEVGVCGVRSLWWCGMAGRECFIKLLDL